MDVSSTAWAVTLGGIALIFPLDELVIMAPRAHAAGIREVVDRPVLRRPCGRLRIRHLDRRRHQFGWSTLPGGSPSYSLWVEDLFVFRHRSRPRSRCRRRTS